MRLCFTLLALIGCTASNTDAETPTDTGAETTGNTTTTPTSNTTPTTTASNTTTATSEPWAMNVDCTQLLPLPLTYTTHDWVPSHEDWTFSTDGYMVGVSGGLKRTPFGGPAELLVPNIGNAKGTRYLPDGNLVIVDVDAQSLIKVDPFTGGRETLHQLSTPNGVAIGADGWAYVTVSGAVVRIDTSNGDLEMIADLPGMSFDGISFSEDYSRLYWNSEFGNIWFVDFDANNDPGPPTQGPNIPISGFSILDGMTVDACGNLYVVEMNNGVWRVTPGGAVALAVDITEFAFMSSLNFGIGVGGWDANSLYIMDFSGKVYETPVGVPSKWEPHF